jgi:hypothetical protein
MYVYMYVSQARGGVEYIVVLSHHKDKDVKKGETYNNSSACIYNIYKYIYIYKSL